MLSSRIGDLITICFLKLAILSLLRSVGQRVANIAALIDSCTSYLALIRDESGSAILHCKRKWTDYNSKQSPKPKPENRSTFQYRRSTIGNCPLRLQSRRPPHQGRHNARQHILHRNGYSRLLSPPSSAFSIGDSTTRGGRRVFLLTLCLEFD